MVRPARSLVIVLYSFIVLVVVVVGNVNVSTREFFPHWTSA